MNHEAQPSGFNLVLDIVDIIRRLLVYRQWKIVVDLSPEF